MGKIHRTFFQKSHKQVKYKIQFYVELDPENYMEDIHKRPRRTSVLSGGVSRKDGNRDMANYVYC